MDLTRWNLRASSQVNLKMVEMGIPAIQHLKNLMDQVSFSSFLLHILFGSHKESRPQFHLRPEALKWSDSEIKVQGGVFGLNDEGLLSRAFVSLN